MLSWDDPGAGTIQSYQVLRRLRDGPVYGDGLGAPGFVVIADDIGSSDTKYTDTSVMPLARYVYRIQASNSVGLSAASNSANAEGVPAAPTGLAVDSRTHNSITLSWSYPRDSTIQSYQVIRRSRDGSVYEDNRGAPGFVVVAEDTGSISLVPPLTDVTYTDTALTPKARYVYSIQARNSVGLSAVSNFATAKTEELSVVLTPTSLEVVEEDGTGGSYTVRLSHQPGQDVTVEVTGLSETDLSLDNTTLTFTTDNWDTAQTVTVKAGQDTDGTNDTETLTHTAAGGEYAGVTPPCPSRSMTTTAASC